MNVLRVNNATVRFHIENYTLQYCTPDLIVFIIDGDGNYVIDIPTIKNIIYQSTRKTVREYIVDNGINLPQGLNTLEEIVQNYATIITYKPR